MPISDRTLRILQLLLQNISAQTTSETERVFDRNLRNLREVFESILNEHDFAGDLDATEVSFDNLLSGLTATDVQEAIDELSTVYNGYIKVTNFEIISTPVGSITIPSGGTLLFDEFNGSTDALVSEINGSNTPTWETPRDAVGDPITVVSINSSGDYVLDRTPTGNIALIYCYRVQRKDFDYLESIGFETLDMTAEEIRTKLEYIGYVGTVGTLYEANGWTNNGDGSITLPEVVVSLHDNINFEGFPKKYTVGTATTGVGISALVDEDTNYIYIDYNGGIPQWASTTVEPDYLRSDNARYMTVYRAGTFLHILDWDSEGSGLSEKILERQYEIRKLEKASGLTLSLGGVNSPIQVNISSGVVWSGIKRVTTSNINSWDHVLFSNYHTSGSWDRTVSGAGSGVANNTYYDNGNDLVILDNNKYVVNWYFKGIEVDAHIYEVIGTGEYNNVALAQLETIPSLPEIVSSHALLVGRIIIQKGATVGVVEPASTIVFGASAVANHNDLSNVQGGTANEAYHLTASQYNQAIILDKLNAITAPTVNNDSSQGYAVGSNWVDITNDVAWKCLDATIGSAVWRKSSEDVLFSIFFDVMDGDPLTYDIRATYAMKINSVTNIVNAPTTTILVNDAAYSLGDPIVLGDKITITTDIAAFIRLNCSRTDL